MGIDPLVLKILANSPRPASDPTKLTPLEYREFYEEVSAVKSKEEIALVKDLRLVGPENNTIIARLYKPHEIDNPAPVVVYFHGGGWVIGSIETHDSLCRSLANRTQAIVISIGYRLAPEHPYPAALEDCYSSLVQLSAGVNELSIDPQRLVVAGDSAGGNLAAAVALLARDRGGPKIRYQLLIYPCCDIDPDRWPSMSEDNEGSPLSGSLMRWFYRHYVGVEKFIEDPYAAPLRAADLSDLPPALIVTAEVDPLRDEGAAYADALAAAGVDVHYECAMGQVHGFLNYADAVPSAAAIRDSIYERFSESLI
tara:strand:+ start:1419 stop:2351 length:933 start_codon:yes stop_codon:yes gene_type:complete